jgi:hypothetical protein
VPRLVLHHIGIDLRRQRICGMIANKLKRPEGQSLDDHLHPEIDEVPFPATEDLGQLSLEYIRLAIFKRRSAPPNGYAGTCRGYRP